MKIAYLITAYHKQIQLIRLINCLGNKAGFENIFVHIDKKASYSEHEILSKTSNLINISKKYPVYWGGYNQLLSILSLVENAVNKQEYDFIVLLSGQDLPVVSYNEMINFFKKNHEQSFITSRKIPYGPLGYKEGLGRVQWYWFMDHVKWIRGVQKFHIWSHYIFEKFNIIRQVSKDIDFYWGSDWWMLPGEVATYCLNEFKTNKKLRQCFKFSFIPSEMFFQTVIGNSKYQDSVTNNNYRFIPWSPGHGGHPDVITNEHKKAIEESGCLFARKFDMDSHPDVFSCFEKNF